MPQQTPPTTNQQDEFPKVGESLPGQGGDIITLTGEIGRGGFGAVFRARTRDTHIEVAVKVESYQLSMVPMEVAVLRAATLRNCTHICRLLAHGRNPGKYAWMAVTLLGEDLHSLRCRQSKGRFTPCTVVQVARESLIAIKQLHDLGFVSRDIKPGNFAPGRRSTGQHHTIFIYDFGLARYFLDQNGAVQPSRGTVGWRGTMRYGSLGAHRREDLSRKDDLESWFYMIVELQRGHLPWRCKTDRALVEREKMELRAHTGPACILAPLPMHCLRTLLTCIDMMTFAQTPDYGRLLALIDTDRLRIRLCDNFDWETSLSATADAMPTAQERSDPAEERDRSDDTMSETQDRTSAPTVTARQRNPIPAEQQQNDKKDANNNNSNKPIA